MQIQFWFKPVLTHRKAIKNSDCLVSLDLAFWGKIENSVPGCDSHKILGQVGGAHTLNVYLKI